MKMIKHLEKIPYDKKLKETGIFTLEKKGLTGDTIFLYFKGGYKVRRLSLHKE